MNFSKLDEEILMNLAFRVTEAYIDSGKADIDEHLDVSENLRNCGGAFVSAYIEDSLRGCIGTFSEDKPIFIAVQNMAKAAVGSDSRFQPISISELQKLELEISVLSPRVAINDISEIEIGRHGIFMSRGANRGTFLPQVAVDQNWTVEEFLSNCARSKAGMDWDGWMSAQLFTYETHVIHSKDLNR